MTQKPVARRKKAGRPRFAPTAAQRQEVARLRAVGMELQEIAAVIGISVPTLNLHFAFELTEGAAKKKAAVYRALEKNALAGNVSAQKAMILQFEKAAAVPQATRTRKEPAPGKKELLEREAMEVPATPRWGNLIQ